LDGGAFAYGVVAPQSQFAVGAASRMAWVVAKLHMFPAIGAASNRLRQRRAIVAAGEA